MQSSTQLVVYSDTEWPSRFPDCSPELLNIADRTNHGVRHSPSTATGQ